MLNSIHFGMQKIPLQ